MKKIVLTCVLIGSSACAAAAQFSDISTGTADIVISQPAPATEIVITPVVGLTTESVQSPYTTLATVSAKTTVDSNDILGVRWSNVGNQVVSDDGATALINESNNPENKLLMGIAGGLESQQTDDAGISYFIGQANGNIDTSIIKVDDAPVNPGVYKVSLDAAIYKP